METNLKEPLQFVYFNSLAWYGARLALDLLKNYAHAYEIVGTTPRRVVSARGQKAILFSFLADREFRKIFSALDLARIPHFSKDRSEEDPIVIMGGAASYQPEPIADLVDIICVGDGEEFLMGIAACLQQKTRQARIDALAELPGAYVPSRRKIIYDSTGFFVKDMIGETHEIIPHRTKLWLSAPQFRGNQQEIEIARGCNKNCAFCSITWRNEFRERPQQNTVDEIMKSGGELAFFSPNTGGVSYYHEIHAYRGAGSKGDITVDSFLSLPYPEENEYKGATFTFGIEGITPRLRRIVGKPISDRMMDELFKRLHAGNASRLQLYFIRNIPGENTEDWDEFTAWYYEARSVLAETGIHTEMQWTPLTKQAHTPLQWFDHHYHDFAERRIKDLIKETAEYQKIRKAGGKRLPNWYVTPSRRKASWLIDNVTSCTGRNAVRFLWLQHKGKMGASGLQADRYIGSGYNKVVRFLRQCNIDPDIMLGNIDLDATLPWSHIVPKGKKGKDRLLKFAKSIQRRLG